ncbi:MAG: DUF1800 family protein [Alphaproteobacteria bacterium]|nr:DUF1800 family protein [Alphaproteobacteria bacterium]
MTLDPRGAALALHRFGFGPRAGTIAAIASDPRGALLAELDKPNAGRIADAGLISSGAASRMASDFVAERSAKQKLETLRQQAATEAAKQEAAKLAAGNPTMQSPVSENAGMEKSADAKGDEARTTAAKAPQPETPMLENFFREAKAHYDGAVRAEIGFVERLVWFWSNHFCINADVTVQAGAYEREAIRPHVLGKFADLLIAAESHSAMLNYLGNSASMGPNSVAGINRNRGLNENLGREVLELHTLGVRTGYSQDDVVSFAKVITGWTTYLPDLPERGGEFLFYPRFHEPGPQTVLGKAYRDTGFEQGKAVLADLARHPATARHVATKLARHFIADEPPAALVETLRQKFVETDGDLWQVARALVMAPESCAPEQTKLKRPSEWMMSYIRAGGFNGVDVRRAAPSLTRLGEPLWRPPAPKGFPDDEAAWIDGIAHRLETANAYAQNPNGQDRLDPKAMLEASLGPLASPETRLAVGRAENKQQAVVLLLMAPEFQRR